MKKSIIFIAILLFSFQLTHCAEPKNNAGGTDIMYSNIEAYPPLEECLNTSYELENLQNFFGYIPPNEYCMYNYDKDQTMLSMKEVNEAFPIECTRKAGQMPVYSVYRVKTGGYYYVFWNMDAINQPDNLIISEENIIVYFSAYIKELPQATSFDSIVLKKSTAEDVAKIDGAVEISFLFSSGIYSFSLLEDGSVMKFSYYRQDKYSSRKDLLVKDVKILSHEEATTASYLSLISECDLPR